MAEETNQTPNRPPASYLAASTVMAAGGWWLGQQGVGPISFEASYAEPVLALTGAVLPVGWWYLTNKNETPYQVSFPGAHLLTALEPEVPPPQSMPWPWKALCLASFSAFFIGAADPEVNRPTTSVAADVPALILADNGWSTARNGFPQAERIDYLFERIDSEARNVIFLPTAEMDVACDAANVSEARVALQELESRSWPENHSGVLPCLSEIEERYGGRALPVYFVSNGLEPTSAEFLDTLERLGPLTVIHEQPKAGPYLISMAGGDTDTLNINVERPQGEEEVTLTLQIADESGQPLLQRSVPFIAEQDMAEVEIDITPALRERMTRVTLNDERTAGTTLMLDDNWQRPVTAMISTSGSNVTLADESTYLGSALGTISDFRQGSVSDLINSEPDINVMFLPDESPVLEQDMSLLQNWVTEGGILIRFAGPRMTANINAATPLLPNPLNSGLRRTEGGLSGSGTLNMRFENGSPFERVQIPDDFEISQYVLSTPEPFSDSRVLAWGDLEDGTSIPLITARAEGSGQVVLFHFPADPQGSNIGRKADFFLDMLRAGTNIGSRRTDREFLIGEFAPVSSLTANGRLVSAYTDAQPLTSEIFEQGTLNGEHPPGYYCQADCIAYNLSDADLSLKPIEIPEDAEQIFFEDLQDSSKLWGVFMAAAMGGAAIFYTFGTGITGRREQVSAAKNDAARPAPAGAA